MGKDSIVQVLMFQNYNFYKIATDSNYLIKLNIIISGFLLLLPNFKIFPCPYYAVTRLYFYLPSYDLHVD